MIILSKWYMYSLFEMIYDCLFERSDSALNHFEMIYLLSLWNDISKETVFCTPLACSECLLIESWPNSIGKHPAEKEPVNPFEMIYDCHFEMTAQNFRTENNFRQREHLKFPWRKSPWNLYFSTQIFSQRLSLSCVKINIITERPANKSQ